MSALATLNNANTCAGFQVAHLFGLVAVVHAVDPLLRASISRVNRPRNGLRCGIVQPPDMAMGRCHCIPL